MTPANDMRTSWTRRTVEIKVWKILAVLIALPILAMWYRVVHQDDEILALVRNEVATAVAGQRTWAGSFVNTNGRTLREVAVTVDLLDAQDRAVAKAHARADELRSGARLDLSAPLPPEAVRLRIYSVQWRMDRSTADRWLHRAPAAALIGPFREPWEFGYLMVDAGQFAPPAR
jgi:hypothetical protein